MNDKIVKCEKKIIGWNENEITRYYYYYFYYKYNIILSFIYIYV